MRLAAQMKGGYYAASEEAVALAASFLEAPGVQPFAILDPCAGEGTAIRLLGSHLGCPGERIHAIELDEGRSEVLRLALPDAQVLGPADFFGCRSSFGSFSFIWLNPPFDDSYDGRRVEDQFLSRATEWLMQGGVMALVCPEHVIGDYSHARLHFTSFYENVTVIPFPMGCRPFNEVIVFGHKRIRSSIERGGFNGRISLSWESIQAPHGFHYRIPVGSGPRVFQKTEPTEVELQRMLDDSPLRFHLKAVPEASPPSPPLPLGIGHVSLLLASGHLDGVVHPEGKHPHVVRGTSRKHSFVSDVTDTENADGSTTTRTTISERIELVIRTIDHTGRIRTFSENEAKEE